MLKTLTFQYFIMFPYFPRSRECQILDCRHYRTLRIGGVNFNPNTSDSTTNLMDEEDYVGCDLLACVYKTRPILPKSRNVKLDILPPEELELFLE